MKICGEAVYATRPYDVYGEIGAHWYEHNHQRMKASVGDIRYTRNKANTVLYATMLKWPETRVVLKTLRGENLSGVTSVALPGLDDELHWMQTDEGMEIALKSEPDYGLAYPIRIGFKQSIVAPIQR